jgi:hypothetical protein
MHDWNLAARQEVMVSGNHVGQHIQNSILVKFWYQQRITLHCLRQKEKK